MVEKYRTIAGGYGKAVAISDLGYSREEAEKAFDILDEDYHISRFFRFENSAGQTYNINGFPQTHVSIDEGIRSIL